MTIAKVTPFSVNALNQEIEDLRTVEEPVTSKTTLSEGIKSIAQPVFEHTPTARGWNILKIGIDPSVNEIDSALAEHGDKVEPIARTVVPRMSAEIIHETSAVHPSLEEVIAVLSRDNALDNEVAMLSRIIDN